MLLAAADWAELSKQVLTWPSVEAVRRTTPYMIVRLSMKLLPAYLAQEQLGCREREEKARGTTATVNAR
ncbi:hypothetical protein E4U40_007394 [Claviceps sp. LM458 group G5]|nr:hypothetical protein E4U40_007394 [Claviceps sp. LM458 group G5]